jgi:predicted dehydrogenase
MKRLQVAIVGAGLMGRWHAYYATRAGAEVVAIVDSKPDAAESLRRRHRRAKGYGTLAEAVMDRPFDIVHLCTGSTVHERLAEAALRADKHVLVEKPLASSAAATELLLALAAARHLRLCAVHQFPFQSGFQRLQRRLGQLGTLVRVVYTVCSAGGNGCDSAERKRILVELLPHAFSLFHGLLGERLAEGRWLLRRHTEDELEALGDVGDTELVIAASLRGRPTRNELTVVGTSGTAHGDLFHGYAVLESGVVSRRHKVLRPFALAGRTLLAATGNLTARAGRREWAYPGLWELFARFYRSVSEAAPTPVSAQEILGAARLSDALTFVHRKETAATGRDDRHGSFL